MHPPIHPPHFSSRERHLLERQVKMLRYLHILTLSLSLPPPHPTISLSLSFSLSLYIYIYMYLLIYLFIWHEGSLIFVMSWKIFSCSLCDHGPWPGIEPVLPLLGAWSLSHWTREVPWYFLFWNLRTPQRLYGRNNMCQQLFSCPITSLSWFISFTRFLWPAS